MTRQSTQQTKFLVQYTVNGSTFGFNIVANNIEEAEQHLKAIAENGTIGGNFAPKITVP